MKILYSLFFVLAFMSGLNAQDTDVTKRFQLDYENGDIVATSEEKEQHSPKLIKTTTSYQDNIFAVFQMDANKPNTAQMLEKGISYVKFSSINGSVKRGDYVTSSDIPGTAMKATQSGKTIGVALEDSKGESQLIKILVQPLWITF